MTKTDESVMLPDDVEVWTDNVFECLGFKRTTQPTTPPTTEAPTANQLAAFEALKKTDSAAKKSVDKILKAQDTAIKRITKNHNGAAPPAGSEDAAAYAEAVRKRAAMLKAITVSPLSPHHPQPLDKETRRELLTVCAADPELGLRAAALAARSDHPEAIIKAAKLVAERLSTGFADPAQGATQDQALEPGEALSYATRLVEAVSHTGPNGAALLEAYLSSNPTAPTDPTLTVPGNRAATAKVRTERVGAALTQSITNAGHAEGETLGLFDGADLRRGPGGAVPLEGPLGALAHVMFDYTASQEPTPHLASHMLETLAYFDGNAEARRTIAMAPTPRSDAARALTAAAAGANATAQGGEAGDVQHAVVNAMLTPVRQGRVGSCFATAGVIRLRKENPQQALEHFVGLATVGTFKPVEGDAVHAVTNLQANDNALVRSLEYSAATAAAADAESKLRTDLRQKLMGVAVSLTPVIKNDMQLPIVQQQIVQASMEAVEFVYDPLVDAGLSPDGRSRQGRYVLVNAATQQPITNLKEFQDAIEPKVLEALDGNYADNSDENGLMLRLHSKKVSEALGANARMPWDISSGGNPHEAEKVLFGGEPQLETFSTHHPDASAEELTTHLLTDLIATLGDVDPAAGVTKTITSTTHAFNLSTDDPVIAELLAVPEDQRAAKIVELLKVPGQAANQVIFRQDQVRDLALRAFDDFLDRLPRDPQFQTFTQTERDQARNALKTADVKVAKPRDVYLFLKGQIEPFLDKCAEWIGRQRLPNGAPHPNVVVAEKNKAKKEVQGNLLDASTSQIVAEVEVPECVIGDTNWGDGVERVVYVILPNPLSNQLALYQRSEPDGKLFLVKHWAGGEWGVVKQP